MPDKYYDNRILYARYEEYRNLKKEKLSEKEIAEHFGLTRLELRRTVDIWKKGHKQTSSMIREMHGSD